MCIVQDRQVSVATLTILGPWLYFIDSYQNANSFRELREMNRKWGIADSTEKVQFT